MISLILGGGTVSIGPLGTTGEVQSGPPVSLIPLDPLNFCSTPLRVGSIQLGPPKPNHRRSSYVRHIDVELPADFANAHNSGHESSLRLSVSGGLLT